MDEFASHTVSIVLSWIFTLPLFLGLLLGLSEAVFKKPDTNDVPRFFGLWLFLCIVFLSPVRHLLFQLTVAESYPMQGFAQVLDFLILMIYMPFVFSALYMIGFIGPILGWVYLGVKEPASKLRLALVGLTTPLACLLTSFIFAQLLPLFGMSLWWVSPRRLIRATNGPAAVMYKYVVKTIDPLDLFLSEERRTKDVRAHVAATYFTAKQRRAYERVVVASLFRDSIEYANQATQRLKEATEGRFFSTIDERDLEEILRLQQAALDKAREIPIDKLNEWHPELGNHYSDEFVGGLAAIIEGHRNNNAGTLFRGQFLLNAWGDWYTEAGRKMRE